MRQNTFFFPLLLIKLIILIIKRNIFWSVPTISIFAHCNFDWTFSFTWYLNWSELNNLNWNFWSNRKILFSSVKLTRHYNRNGIWMKDHNCKCSPLNVIKLFAKVCSLIHFVGTWWRHRTSLILFGVLARSRLTV